MKKQPATMMWAALFTIAVPAIGYVSFGPWPALLFLIGYMGGFILWLALPTRAPFSSIKVLYWITFGLFILHRIEEKVSGFFAVLSDITGVAVPEIVSFPIILLVIVSIGVWLFGPLLYQRGYEFGHYLVWTFFASMGITELAHFVFPLFTQETYGYFPGMLSVFFLAPVAWLAMHRLTQKPPDKVVTRISTVKN